MPEPIYIFIDESGDFNFSKSGTKYYTFTALITKTPCRFHNEIKDLQISILSGAKLSHLGLEYLDEHLCEHFHATEDKQPVRDLFFNLISSMNTFKANSIVIQKNKTNPSLYKPKTFYPQFLCSLIDYIFQAYSYSKLCIFVDGCAVNQNKAIFKKTIATEIRKRDSNASFRIFFPPSAGYCNLQVTDYINWAIYRKWEKGDLRSYDLIKHLLQAPERDIFRRGTTEYY